MRTAADVAGLHANALLLPVGGGSDPQRMQVAILVHWALALAVTAHVILFGGKPMQAPKQVQYWLLGRSEQGEIK